MRRPSRLGLERQRLGILLSLRARLLALEHGGEEAVGTVQVGPQLHVRAFQLQVLATSGQDGRGVQALELGVAGQEALGLDLVFSASRLQVAYTSRPPGATQRAALFRMRSCSWPSSASAPRDAGAISGRDCGARCRCCTARRPARAVPSRPGA